MQTVCLPRGFLRIKKRYWPENGFWLQKSAGSVFYFAILLENARKKRLTVWLEHLLVYRQNEERASGMKQDPVHVEARMRKMRKRKEGFS